MGNQAAGGLLSPWLAARRLAAVRPWLSGRVLDFGCGGGSVAGLFSQEAAEEHEHRFDLSLVKDVLADAGFTLYRYQRFLFGQNQLVVALPMAPESSMHG